jgi:glycosyltransferase involved in cell wall biosynthesis
MNISICITLLNEEGTIAPLLDSLLNQSKRPEQIIIVDGGSEDKTVEIIRHFQQKDNRIKLLVEKCSRARGRNLSIEIAKGDVIAMTDAGCVAEKNWLKNLTAPFSTGRVDVSAGFYKMTGNSPFQKAESVYLGVRPRKFNYNFLPSTRSVAFTKKIWEEVGGFPEDSEGAAEDTIFNYKLIKAKAKVSRVKDAIVEWGMPESLSVFFWKIFAYSKGDAKSKIWIFPGKGLMSHNIKSLFILFRYLIGLTILLFLIKYNALLPVLIILFFIYLLWAFRKVFLEFGDWKVSLWGPVLQISSDLAIMVGFWSGIIYNNA